MNSASSIMFNYARGATRPSSVHASDPMSNERASDAAASHRARKGGTYVQNLVDQLVNVRRNGVLAVDGRQRLVEQLLDALLLGVELGGERAAVLEARHRGAGARE